MPKILLYILKRVISKAKRCYLAVYSVIKKVVCFAKWLTMLLIRLLICIGNTVLKSWRTSIPEYPMYIVAVTAGIGLGILYYWIFNEKHGQSTSFMTGLLTVAAAPLVLVMWKWRNTHKITEFKIQNRNANEALLLKAGEQLGHESEISRLCGIESIDRYARLMMKGEPDYPEFQRAVSMLCGFARQKSAEKKRSRAVKVTQMGDAYGTSGEVLSPEDKKNYLVHETDYKSCVDLIFRLMRDYYDELMGCCVFFESWYGFKECVSEELSFPVVDLSYCDLREFSFNDRYFVAKSNFTSADFSNCDMSNSYFSYATFENSVMDEINLSSAVIGDSHFAYVSLRKANLENCDMHNSELKYVILDNAKMWRITLSGSKIYNTQMNEVDLKEARMNNSRIENSAMIRAEMNCTKLDDVKIYNSKLDSAVLNNASLDNACIGDSTACSAIMISVSMFNTKIEDSDFSSSTLSQGKLHKCNFYKVRFENAMMFNTDLTGALLHDSIFHNASMSGSVLINAFFNKYTKISPEQLASASDIFGSHSFLQHIN